MTYLYYTSYVASVQYSIPDDRISNDRSQLSSLMETGMDKVETNNIFLFTYISSIDTFLYFNVFCNLAHSLKHLA